MTGGLRPEATERIDLVQQAIELRLYSQEMYGSKDIFQPAIDYEGKKYTWRELGEILTIGDTPTYNRFLDKVDCASFLKKDLQLQNILTQYNLRNENAEEKSRREYIELLLGYNSERRINFPLYNMDLTKHQYDKLFYQI
mmetsp:Transcript_31911/g.42241  ORF Transcript_31911/g.42241 Transcript_31911/m.42241 type:complete len:140 (+) Transcript_31911:493-912(+)|eukprot:CAMPEP_0185599112 /NCGR_PEP_ID=MMETSP0434-20130131/82470_1 /TAXON_ID=626734 ORGANISM="Favella taraikaensis, Strain Fe Narragansett Bay" /NCGR_SAMPLE_ID=MMETSP0434 /ASSEMBLY_ACC=CAM_ASM_000379 /LENGTH=139 /DNA_ID=CAMNT_0028228369 /DNA_START=480 /DNA_END=899 /DNA_ORIENTATION=-